MLYSALIISIIALVFSKINIVDYKKLNQSLLKKNIAYQYNLKLPKSKNYRNPGKRDLQKKIYIVKSKTGKTLVFIDHHKIPIKNISKNISDWQSKKRIYIRPYLNCVLLIDKSTKMTYVDAVINQLQKINLDGISFGVSATNEENHFPYKEFSIRINELKTDDSLNKFSNIITVNLLKNNNYLMNNHKVRKSELSNVFKNLISENSDYIVRVHTDKNTYFGAYYPILSSLHNAIQELRNDYAKNRYKQNYEWLDRNKTSIIRYKYPFRFTTFK
jgi:biopolymer transport protein ExbD